MKRSLLIICLALFLCVAVSCSYVSNTIGGILGGNGDNNDQAGVPGTDVIIPDNDIAQTPDDTEKPEVPGDQVPEDEKPEIPEETLGNSATGEIADVLDEKNALASGVDLVSDNGLISATLPEGALVAEGATSLTFSVKELEESAADITLAENESSLSVDVHIDGLSPDNETVIKVYIKALLPIGLNMGNYSLYHVENGETVLMTLLGDEEPVHNSFEYDPVTGDTTMYLKSFSEIALVSDEVNAWNGTLDYSSWFSPNKGQYTIANADQLAALSAIVGGMSVGKDDDGNLIFAYTYTETEGDVEYTYHDYSFAGETVTLIADINLGDDEANNNSNIIFYPIGYWNSEETYEKTNTAISSGFYTFEGTFNGNGNTIKNFYQNTWEMKGDHDWYSPEEQYYRDGMGLFGKVYGATIKNLTVENFSSDGEIATTGVIAAYADSANGKSAIFENITILNCNPRVYNIGNGGIVGCAGWYSRNSTDVENVPVIFKNITVDQTNKISALWGTYDVSCGGILGQYYPDSKCGISFDNCHVAAVMDVHNDVCANYQYYWYRYSGMFIGTIRANTKDSNGYTVADTTGITATNCTYTYGDWNEYWYCELVKNSLASYTHDHQFSRLTTITSLSEIQDENGNWNKEGNFVIPNADNTSAECYHIFKNSEGNLYQHFHDVADESNPEIFETKDINGDGELNDLKEDRTCYYIPFGQIMNGLGYGVKPFYSEAELNDSLKNGFKLVEKGTVLSEEKFEAKDVNLTYRPGEAIKLGDILNAIVDESKISKSTIYIAVSPATESDVITATCNINTVTWGDSTITFNATCSGTARLVITDYFYCKTTTVYLSPESAREKFEAKAVGEQNAYTQIKLEDLFALKADASLEQNISITVTDPSGEATTISATSADWTSKTLNLVKDGEWSVVIKENDDYCKTTEVKFDVNKVKKFTEKFDKDFLYRIGNMNAVKLGSLFGEVSTAVPLSAVNVVVNTINGASGVYTSNATWTNGTIQFSDTGVVKVTISADGAEDVELLLEVVDAKNYSGVEGESLNATSNNVVLLCNIGSGFTVSGRYAFYGNGFTLNYTGNGQYLNNGLKQGIVTVAENGTLDNLRIVASIYPASYLYYEEVKKGPSSVDGDKTRYHYQLSAVAASGNATISNCYIYGARNNIYIGTGNVTVKDTILECGTVSNIQIISNNSHTVTFENLTTIQYLVSPTIFDNESTQKDYKMIGFGIFVGDGDADTVPTNPKLVFNGDLKQYNWVSETEVNGVNSYNSGYIKNALNAAIGNATYKRDDGTANMGVVFLNNQQTNIENNTGIDYQLGEITIMQVTGQVYSIPKTETEIYTDYASADKTTENSYYQPQFKYDSTLGGQYVAEGGDEHCYREGDTIKVMFPSGDTKEINLATFVNIVKYTGQNLNLSIACKDSFGNSVAVTSGKITLSAAGEYTVTYTVTDTLFYDKDGNTVTGSVNYSWNVTISVSLKDTAIPDAYFDYVPENQKMGYAKKNLFAGGNTQYLPFLAGLKIYDYIGQNVYLRFDGDNDFNKIAAAEITGYTSANHVLIKVTLTDGGVINVDTTARAAAGGSTYTGTLNTSGSTLYYVNAGTTSATTTTWVISNYIFIGNNGVEINSGAVTFSNCENGSVPTGSFGTTIEYIVTYNANNGDCGQTVGYATSAATEVTLPTPTRSGYTFLGWYTAAVGGTKAGGAGESYKPSSNITLYAQWGAPCTVTYNANGGECEAGSEKFDGKTLVLPAATRDGYTFLGWYTAATGGKRIGSAGESYNPTGDITLYAQWQEPITVKYDANGGSCGTTSELYDGDLKLPTPTRTGYTFNGWYTEVSGGNRVGGADDDYTPSDDITLYAQWQINSYTIKVTTSNANVTVNGAGVSNNGTVSVQYGTRVTVVVTYTQNNSKSTTITGTDGTSYTSPFDMPAQDVTINAKSSGSCVTPDTLVTLMDGTQKEIQYVTYEDQLLVWNFYTGEYDIAYSSIVMNHGYSNYTIVALRFSDGTEVKTINGHGFFDTTANQYVIIDEANVASYVGHEFVKQSNDAYATVQLVSYEIYEEYTESWSILTAGHYNCILEGMWTVTPAEVEGSPDYLMPFDIDDDMKYNETSMREDIEKYGLYTYDDFAEYMTVEQYEALALSTWKVSVGKGYIAWDDILYLISIHIG